MSGRPIRLTIAQAALIATATLGRRVPQATIRSWRHRDLLAGGRGWVSAASLAEHLDRWRTRR